MLGTFRKHYKKWLIGIAVLVIPTFIMWGGYYQGRTSRRRPEEDEIAKVNGVPIRGGDLQARLSQMQRSFQEAMGDNYDPDMFDSHMMAQRALNELIGRVLLLQESNRLRINVSQEAVEARLRDLPVFKTDGKFNPQKYNQFVAQQGYDWSELSDSLKTEIRNERLLTDVEESAKLTDNELREEYRLRNEKIKVKYLAVKPAQFEPEVKLTDDTLKEHYENNRESYMEAETVVVKYVAVKIAPTDADRQAVRKRSEDILARAKTEPDFSVIARRYSEAADVADNGGEVGWVQEALLPPALAAAVSKLKEGELSGIVETEQALYIFKCEGRKVEEGKKQVKLRQMLLKLSASADTHEKIASQVDVLVKEAQSSHSLETSAQKVGVQVKETRPLSRTERFIEDVGMDSPAFMRAAFGLKEPGELSSAVITPRAYYVLQLVERKDAHIREFADVKESINKELARLEALKLARKKVTELAGGIKSLDDLATVDKTLAATVKVSEPFTRMGFVPEVAGDRAFFNAAFSAQPGKLSPPILGTNAAYLLEVIEKTPFDEQQYAENKEKFREQLLRQKKTMILGDWEKWLQAKADIRRNDELFREIIGS